ncbi:type II secretion system protein G [Rugamonas sp. A1-17]|nr:type II secretion system protein G [Rugamonas sp. A1-17]
MIELLVALAIIGMLLTLAAPRYFTSIDRTREDVLREDLYILRNALDHFYADRGVNPEKLDDLVSQHYLRAIPIDPLLNSSKGWVLVLPAGPSEGAVANVRSGAPNSDRNGIPYRDW